MKNQKGKKGKKGKSARKAVLEKIRLNAAGVDVGSEEIYVATIEGAVQMFSTFTQGINESLKYIKSKGVDSVVMEATGIYWWPIYETYINAGLEVYIVNACHAKNVPGRKTDVLDSEWLRELHTYGLLRSSFIPGENTCRLRVYMRLRHDHIEMASTHVQHIQKNLDAMNIKLHNVLSSLTGKSGIQIIEAILAGERDPKKLTTLCTERIIPEKLPKVELSLEGYYKEEYLFGLRQALDAWYYYQSKIKECDTKIDELLKSIIKDKSVPEDIKPPKPISNQNKLQIKGLHKMLMTYTAGKDASQLPGFNDYSLLRVISETGIDMTPWPTEKHFTSWLNLAPWQNSSGKKKGTRQRKIQNRAGQMFREMARSVGNSKYQALGGFYRRIKSRHGAKVANKATARKIAVLYYRLMKYGFDYVEKGLDEYERQYKEKMLKSLTKKARQFGMELIPEETA
ncbi:MAG: IS110 family transposase [Bacteroidales bacterium]